MDALRPVPVYAPSSELGDTLDERLEDGKATVGPLEALPEYKEVVV